MIVGKVILENHFISILPVQCRSLLHSYCNSFLFLLTSQLLLTEQFSFYSRNLSKIINWVNVVKKVNTYSWKEAMTWSTLIKTSKVMKYIGNWKHTSTSSDWLLGKYRLKNKRDSRKIAAYGMPVRLSILSHSLKKVLLASIYEMLV